MSLPPLAILAGGTATRLRPITHTIPKSLVPVAGEPFIAHQLRLVRRRGIERVVLLIGYLGDQIQAFVGDGSRFGLDVQYSSDGTALRGTGGAVCHARSLLGPLFFVTYGDSYLDVPFEPLLDTHAASGSPAVMTVFHNRDLWEPSNIAFDGRKVLVHDKAAYGRPGVEWIDFGLMLFESGIFDEVEANWIFDLSALTAMLAEAGRLAGVEVKQRFYEIGKPEGLSETESHLRGLTSAR
jgi:NDP-sugar pyrophosphorylase family protein